MYKRNSVSIIIRTLNNKFLLQHRDNTEHIEYPDCWGLFGGWIECGESPEEALSREIKEEIHCSKSDNLGLSNVRMLFQEERADKGWMEFVFYGEVTSDTNQIILKEGQAIAEFSILEILSILKLAPHHKNYLEKYFLIENKCAFESLLINKKMNSIKNYLELTVLGNVKDYKALEKGDGYILPSLCNPTGVFHTKVDAKIIALLIFKKDEPRGFHYHLEKIEYMTILSGKLKCKFSLPESDEQMELMLEEGQQIKILPGCIHTYTAIDGDVYAIEYAPQRYKESDVIVIKS